MNINFYSQEIDFQFSMEPQLIELIGEMVLQENQSIHEINIIFMDDEALLEVNKKYLHHDYYTDIITFPYQYEPIHTDLFISVDRVRDNANTLKQDFTKELSRVIIHGVLHMLGYKDKEELEKNLMREKEETYLAQIKSADFL